MPEVKCTVSNCEYWGDPNVCTADQILITAGSVAGIDKFGFGAEWMAPTPVLIAQDSFCWTMTPRAVAVTAPEELVELEAALASPGE